MKVYVGLLYQCTCTCWWTGCNSLAELWIVDNQAIPHSPQGTCFSFHDLLKVKKECTYRHYVCACVFYKMAEISNCTINAILKRTLIIADNRTTVIGRKLAARLREVERVGWWRGFRARDKKKNIADEKAQSQRRLLRTTKRHEAEKTERQRQKEMLDRRKEELVGCCSRPFMHSILYYTNHIYIAPIYAELQRLLAEFDIEPLKVQCLGIYLEPFWRCIWNLLAQPIIMEPFKEPCIIHAGTVNGRCVPVKFEICNILWTRSIKTLN